MTTELGRKKTHTFEGKSYAVGIVYMFDELPPSVRKLIERQADAIQARFGRDPLAMDYELMVIPYDDLEGMLRNHFGERLEAELDKPDIQNLAKKFERGGVTSPAVGEEGWEILLAAALVGEHVPYFRVIAPLEEIPRTFIPSLEGDESLDGRRRRKGPPKSALPDYQAREMRQGFWRMLQRVHRGIPGFAKSGHVYGEQFNGGLAGVNSGWLLAPNTMPLIDAVPVTGFYLFGAHWPQVLSAAGMGGDHAKLAKRLYEEFGITPDKDLKVGTEPYTPTRAAPKVKDRALMGAAGGEPSRVRPWGRCGSTLFWRSTPAEVEAPVVYHVNPVDISQIVVDRQPTGLVDGAVLIRQLLPAAHAPHGWSSEEFHQAMWALPEILSAAVAVWFGWLGPAEGTGASRQDIMNAFVRIAQGRKNAILSGLAYLFDMGHLHHVERRMLILAEGSPAHVSQVDVEAEAQITEATIVVPAENFDQVVDEILASFGVMDCG